MDFNSTTKAFEFRKIRIPFNDQGDGHEDDQIKKMIERHVAIQRWRALTITCDRLKCENFFKMMVIKC